jgi:hypothetical protein
VGSSPFPRQIHLVMVRMRSVADRVRELNPNIAAADDVSPVIAPRNQLGEIATKTRDEAIARLQEKASSNHGRANRERIARRISEEQRR